LIAVALAIAATWIFHLNRYGIGVVGPVHSGMPVLAIPVESVSKLMRMVPMALSMFLVILAQSAATSRSFAQKYNEPLNENQDLLALFAANMLAGVSSTFVVNGSPTKTAVAESAGARTQVTQLVTAALTIVVLLFATSLIAMLPNAALAALVFLIGLNLINVRALRQIYSFRKSTFAVAMAALVGVVVLGVERGIFFAIALSIIDHLRQEYHPKDVVLKPTGQFWSAVDAAPGMESAPGLLVYRFEAPLFFANADYFAERIKAMTTRAPNTVDWLIIDMVSMSDIDYTAGLTLLETLKRVQQQGVHVAVAQAQDVTKQLKDLGITELIGSHHIYSSVAEAVLATGMQSDEDS
jgi:MFS superfamily sulfate permease-like transporter